MMWDVCATPAAGLGRFSARPTAPVIS